MNSSSGMFRAYFLQGLRPQEGILRPLCNLCRPLPEGDFLYTARLARPFLLS